MLVEVGSYGVGLPRSDTPRTEIAFFEEVIVKIQMFD